MKWVKNKYLYLLLVAVFTCVSVGGVGGSICYADTNPDQLIVDNAKSALVLANTDEWVKSNIILPATGENGTTITWTSDQTGFIANDGVLLKQPTYNEGPKDVNLTATISFGTASTTKIFPITIRPTPNLILNSGFEEGFASPWQANGYFTAPTVVVQNEFHNGKQSILVAKRQTLTPTGLKADYSRIRYDLPSPLTLVKDKRYIVSVWAKIKDVDNELTCTMKISPNDGDPSIFNSTINYNDYTVNLSNDWKEIKTSFKSAVGKGGEVASIFTYGNYDHFSYYLDDFSVQPVVPYTISATGAPTITIPLGSNVKNETYTYSMLNQLGTADYMSSETATWSVVGNPAGVSINPSTGVLQVNATATEGTVTLCAAANPYSWLKKDIQVQLKAMPAMAPTAKNVQITSNTAFIVAGTSAVGDTLTSSYEYADDNLNLESGSTYKWVAVDSANAMSGEIRETGTTSAETPVTYVAKQSDVGKYIKFIVTPKTTIAPMEGLEVGSNAIVIQGPPVVKNVKIVGDLAVGSKLFGSYDYSHPNGYLEAGSTYKWVSGGQVVGTDRAYTVSLGDAGQSIYFEVTPASNEEPKVGLPVASQTVSIPQVSNNTGGSTGRRSGVTSISVVKPVETPQPTPTPSTEALSQFSDLDHHWAKADVEKLVAKGIIKGKDDKSFAPDLSITRAEFASIIARALGLKQTKYSNSFNDVDANSWYADDLQTVADSKLIAGSEGAFRPNDNITREEMAKIVVEAYKIVTEKEVPKGNTIQFEDQDNMGIWAVDYINSATELGLITGIDNTHFDPKAVATRAQAAVIIKRLLDNK